MFDQGEGLFPDKVENIAINETVVGIEFDEGGVGIVFEKLVRGLDGDGFVVYSVNDEGGNSGIDSGIVGVLLGIGDELVSDLGVLFLFVMIDGVKPGIAPGVEFLPGL